MEHVNWADRTAKRRALRVDGGSYEESGIGF